MSLRMTGADLFDRLQSDFDNLFGDLLFSEAPRGRPGAFPPVNLWEDENNIYVECEIPGVKKEQLEISVLGKKLTISGERTREEVKDVKLHRSERPAGAFSRVVTLPREVNADAIEARLEDGVLEITLPRSEASRPRKIAVR